MQAKNFRSSRVYSFTPGLQFIQPVLAVLLGFKVEEDFGLQVPRYKNFVCPGFENPKLGPLSSGNAWE